MLESLAAWVLKHYLGKYVENLNTDQLSIGLLQGQVELENLPLKKDALRQVGLPIQIKAGYIGKIKLQIPIRQIRSAPWVILIEKLYLVAGPVDLSEWDEESEEQALQEQKMSALEALEAQWRANVESQEQGYYASSYSSWMSFGTSIITNIVENLQLNVTDVHFRYEDCLCIPSLCFTTGVTIDSLVAQSCNENWEPGFASGEIGFKIVELLKFAIYWDDCLPNDMLAGKESADFMNSMRNVIFRGRHFLLDHVSGVAHIKRNRSKEPLRSKATPRIVCDVLFNEFPITLSDKQYAQMILWMKGLSVINTRIQNRHIRPQTNVQESPESWWKYSCSAVLQRIRPNRYSWDIAKERAKDNVAYVNVFEKILQNPNVTLTAEEKRIKERVEYNRSFEELRILREISMRRVKPIVRSEPPKVVAGNKKNFISAWFPQWWYSNSLQYSPTEVEQELEGEILDVLNNPNDATYLKRDVVFGQFNFSLKQGSVKLCASVYERKQLVSVMDLEVEKVLLGFEYRPRSNSYRTTIALGSVYLRDQLTKETAFPMLVSPQGKEGAPSNIDSRNVSKLLSHAMVLNQKASDETLFQLSYEYKPINSSVDYRIHLKTQSLDIVYNPEAVKWLSDFFAKPLHHSTDTNLRTAARQKYQAIKTATKNELIKNWEQILAGDLSSRKTWDIELDISAPQIIFVEHFCDKNAVIVVVDFGRLHFTNRADSDIMEEKRDSDDEEAFQTPCSTPPGSEASPVGSEPSGLKLSSISEFSLHEKLYDRYSIELSEMQVLIGKVRDNWKYAHLKGTSVLHVLDRFNISMQVERRLVYTADPQFPSLSFSGTLPRLVVHINEQKISALRAMFSIIFDQSISSPYRSPDIGSADFESDVKNEMSSEQDIVDERAKEMTKLIVMQFIVQQLAIEVQSRNRSIAELQVSGVRAACTIRSFDTSVTLSVHSLLLVDALQTFGRDFELLVASHKHVGMDSVSGSIRDSEPTSPVSPASPEPSDNPASPVALSQALNSLQSKVSGYYIPVPAPAGGKKPFRVSSPVQQLSNFPFTSAVQMTSPGAGSADSEALITIELTFVSGLCPGHDGQPLQIAAIQFNNLDIIANQETIVELLGFVRRVFPPSSTATVRPTPVERDNQSRKEATSERPSVGDDELLISSIPSKVEATFDFHRLNVLLLRAVAKDGIVIGRKICTTTMTQAKIKATVGEEVVVEGSLGGIQIVDLTPEGQKHQRILSLGADPLTNDMIMDLSVGLYTYGTPNISSEKTAFSFSVKRSLKKNVDDGIDLKVRLASVWYTHSPLLVRELQSCATEFKQYLSNLAKSIKSAATEMAIGFVHARAESLAQSLSMSGRLSASLYGGSTSEVNSPKRRRKSFTQSVETLGNTPYTPYSPCDDGFFDPIDIRLDVILDTPVIILPMSPTSDQVFVAHLGKITLKNRYCDSDDSWGSRIEKYNLEIRDMNVYSLTAVSQGINVPINAGGDSILNRPDKMYPCSEGKPILHDTVIEIVAERVSTAAYSRSWDFVLEADLEPQYSVQVSGCVVGPLKVSLSREQYQQLLESISNLIVNSSLPSEADDETQNKRLDDIQEEGSESITGVSMLSLDPALRARMLNSNPIGITNRQKSPAPKPMSLRVIFELPEFTVELSGDIRRPSESGLVSISFRDFVLNYDQTNSHASYLQMSLKSLVMEDLLVSEDSKNRFLVVSSAAPEHRTPRFAVSQSCPNLSATPFVVAGNQSLPDRFGSTQIYPTSGPKLVTKSKPMCIRNNDNECPCTPPPSPRDTKSPVPSFNREENLVLINVTIVDRESPNYITEYDSMDRLITVDFNCLDVIANIESWVVIFDFFGIRKSSEPKKNDILTESNSAVNQDMAGDASPQQTFIINTKLDLEVRSLTLVLIRPEYEVAKANISFISIKSVTSGNVYKLEGRLGSMSIADLTPYGKLYRERFLTTGNQALHVHYVSYGNCEENRSVRPCDSEFHLEMSSVVYVHTQRFLGEVSAYFQRFSQLQAFMAAMRSTDRENQKLEPSSRMLIEINAGSPVLLLPLSSLSPQLLVADLGKLTVRNKFRTAGLEGVATSVSPEGTITVKCLLDIMSVDLVNMDLFAGRRCNSDLPEGADFNIVDIGNIRIIKEGPSLLPDKCHLKLKIDRNLDTHLSREVPDISVKGTLNKLEASLDLSQYKLIRGLLAYNIGENMQDLYDANDDNDSFGLVTPKGINGEPVWLMSSIHLDLVNVVVHLRQKHGEGVSLACINFIKSRLVVETFSDRSQDIDLVSSEILIADTRFQDEPEDKRCNIFTNILQPMGIKGDTKHSKEKNERLNDVNYDSYEKGRQDSSTDEGCVQAEVHHRRRKDFSKATVLLNNMRLMAVLDWWEIIRDFILSTSEAQPKGTTADVVQTINPAYKHTAYISGSTGVVTKCPTIVGSEVIPYEFKLNITDSEIVLIEDTSVWDSNAIILKSTTVISYRPEVLEKPLSCNLNHCEVFSCVLGMEDETALSIIDPVTVNMEVTLRPNISEARGLSDAMFTSADRTLEIQMQHLCVRLSYHDFRMLSQMLESIPRQTYRARARASDQRDNFQIQTLKLSALGFSEGDCVKALEFCQGQLDDAALWLTQNAAHVPSDVDEPSNSNSAISFQTVEVKLSCLSICVIDDCRDADVPLLELSLSQLYLKQEINGPGSAKFLFTSDYYNRVLSGWEPFIEPWRCSTNWEHYLTSGLSKNHLQIIVSSDELLNINVTTTLMELYSMVKDNWTQDYYSPHKTCTGNEDNKSALRRRSPFVPYALKNDTNSVLWFTVLINTTETISEPVTLEQDESWTKVNPQETVPFTFGGRGKVRHRDTHKVRVHQIAVRVDKWGVTSPVSVDKVGVYFRQAPTLTEGSVILPPARLVFSVTLDGSARKLVTVRSALVIRNHLNETVEAQLENPISYPEVWEPTMLLRIPPNSAIPVPLSHSLAQIWIRPLSLNQNRYDAFHAFSNSSLGWSKVKNPREVIQEVHKCHSNGNRYYRFVANIRRENFPNYTISAWPQPAHTITLLSPLEIINLLPCDLYYSVKEGILRGYIKPGLSASVHEVDCDSKFEVHLHIENFPKHGTLLVPTPISSFTTRIKLHDESGRRLDLNVAVHVSRGAALKISVSAPYWIINKTSLPLVFKQEGTSIETAGQFKENEIARVITPLLFSLSDPDASPTIQARVGALCHPDRNPQWCQHFHLHVGVQVRKLNVSQRDNRSDIVYLIGINIRAGKGRYRHTNIVTLSPRFQFHNKSSYQLQFAQKCLATTLNDPGAHATYATAVKDCSLAWHWPKLDKDLLLCVRLLEVKNCLWSKGFRIDSDDSFHINVRDKYGKMHFLRVEIVLQSATYFVVFTNGDTMPPPVMINNFSQVPIQFYQSSSNLESLQSTVRPQTSVPYAWDLPLGPRCLTLVAPGGATATYDINSSTEDASISLTYENFIYIAFTATFNHVDLNGTESVFDPLDVESQQLVLDCVDECRVVLNRKQHGVRSQLWRMTADGQLQHEGSSPPRDPRSKSYYNNDKVLVLDIAGTAPQPTQCVALVLRRPDKRRSLTQTWRFTPDGRLCCAHKNMCVQAKDGFFGLHQGNEKSGAWQKWSEAVLGPGYELAPNSLIKGVPIEQAVSRMKMRPGSGCLSVSVSSDGPTRVVKIIDPKDTKVNTQSALIQEIEWSLLPSHQISVLSEASSSEAKELQLTVQLKAGFGVSIVSRKPPEELLFLHVKGFRMNTVRTPLQQTFDCTIQDIQCDNQLFDPQCPVLLYVTRGLREDEPKKYLPAVQISAHKLMCKNTNAHIYKHFIVTVKTLSLCLEERLVLKLYAMFDNHTDTETEDAEESDFETQRMIMEATSVHATRYYFGILQLVPSTVRLSFVTSAKLPSQLQALKRKIGLTLVKFEDAAVELKPFIKKHPFETAQSLINSIVKHFKEELKWQAAFILGSVDFLGNPVGFLNDVTEGFSGLFLEGNVSALFKNVAHGISNSAAKVTESLSDGLGRVILDDTHEETRQRIRKLQTGSSGEHLVAGLKVFGFGLLGGFTSVIKQSYEGAANEGLLGFFAGFGKGLVGTVTKPVVGVLDLATETASAVRDSSKSSIRQAPPSYRLPRCVVGPGGLLPLYSAKQSQGQEFLYTINDRNFSESLLTYEILRSDTEDLRILISSDSVRVFTSTILAVVLEIPLESLYHSQPVSLDERNTGDELHYIELTMRADAGNLLGQNNIKRPRVRCDSREIAVSVSEQINYAKALFEEKSKTLISSQDLLDE